MTNLQPSMLKRTKSAASSLNSSSNMVSSTVISSLNNEFYYNVNNIPSKKPSRQSSFINESFIKSIPFNLDSLSKSSKVLKSKCLTTFWRNYAL